MKNLIIIPLLLLMAMPCLATENKEWSFVQMKSRYDKVKVYQQAGTCSPVLTNLDKGQDINVLRESVLNGGIWSIVYVDEKPGYVLTSELYEEPVVVSKNKSKKQKAKIKKNNILSQNR